jgi:SAM-dependent methyltransferase
MDAYPYSNFPAVHNEGANIGAKALKRLELPNYSIFRTDANFDRLYPRRFQLMSARQWTPLTVVRKAAKFLATPGSRVLDIGSGLGKFCLAAAFFNPKTNFYGVEQREELNHYAETAKAYTKLENAHFIHANITQINFEEFDNFYFYNAFFENIDQENAIDNKIETSYSLYTYYTEYLLSALKTVKSGTRLVTYQCLDEVVQFEFKLVSFSENGLLRMYIKA